MTVSAEWTRCKPWIQAALDKSLGLETIEDVERKIADGIYQFWAGERCAAISQIDQYEQRKALMVTNGGGDLDELVNRLEPAMCAFALEQGCDLILGTGRKGWERALETHGYRFGWVTMVKELKA